MRVDLSTNSIEIEEFTEDFYELYPGGKALAGFILLNEMSPHTDPFAPENVLVVANGLLTGAPISTATRYVVSARSPLTMGYGESEAGGFWGDRVCIGFTDQGGNMDILASLQTSQSLLLELYDSPEIVKRKSDEIPNIWLQYYDELSEIILETGRGTTPWAPIWTPDRCYMLQSDFSAMISPEMFEKFVVPDLITCCERIDHTFYHLDGKGQINHLDILLLLGGLDGIQWIPGEGQQSPASWLPILKRIIDAGKLCQLYVSAKDARIIVRELGGRGFAFYITDTLDPDEADSLLRDLTSENDRNLTRKR